MPSFFLFSTFGNPQALPPCQPSKAQLKHHLLQVVFLDLPLPCQQISTPRSLFFVPLKSVILEGH